MEIRGHLHVPRAARSCSLVTPCPPGISFNAHTPICNPALGFLPSQMISCFPLPALYLVQVPQALGEKKFQRFAWGCEAGSHVRQSLLSDPALMLWIAASRMPVACPHGSAGSLSLKHSLDLVSGSSTRRDWFRKLHQGGNTLLWSSLWRGFAGLPACPSVLMTLVAHRALSQNTFHTSKGKKFKKKLFWSIFPDNSVLLTDKTCFLRKNSM